jgi:hypothetical protein
MTNTEREARCIELDKIIELKEKLEQFEHWSFRAREAYKKMIGVELYAPRLANGSLNPELDVARDEFYAAMAVLKKLEGK